MVMKCPKSSPYTSMHKPWCHNGVGVALGQWWLTVTIRTMISNTIYGVYNSNVPIYLYIFSQNNEQPNHSY